MDLRVSRTFNLPDEVADDLIERLSAAGEQMTASQITYARSDPQGHELSSEDWPKVRDALSKADVPGVTGRLKINAKRDVDKPAVIQAVTFAKGEVKFVFRTTINPS